MTNETSITRGSSEDRMAYDWARTQQGYEGAWSDWQAMPLSDRQAYEQGAAGHDEPRQVLDAAETQSNSIQVIDAMYGREYLIRDTGGLGRVGHIPGPYTHAYPSDRSEVMGWGTHDGDRQWYRLGDADGPETAWEIALD